MNYNLLTTLQQTRIKSVVCAVVCTGGSGGSGTVTSVTGVTGIISVATATTTPTLSFDTQAANLVFAGPTTGVAATPTFRALVAGDIPDLTAVYQPLDSDLTAIAALTVNGALIKTSGVWSMAAHPAAAGRFLRSSSVSAIAWSTLTIPNTATTGDILIANTTNQLTTIGIGAEGDILTVSSGIPAWAVPIVTLGANTFTGIQTFSLTSIYATNTGIDSAAVLNVGATNATTVNLGTGSGNTNINIGTSGTNTIQIGNANSTVNILGTTIYENVTNLNVSDKLITINKGGAAGSAGGTGFEIEENNVVTGYIKTTGGRDGYLFLAPNNANDVSFLFTNISGARSYTLPNASGTLAISATSPIVLNATTGDISLTQTSITSLGTIGAGTWQGTVIAPAYGGTGVANNAASTITISGNFATTLTVTGVTGVTLPTTGTLATLAGTEAFTNKTMVTQASTTAAAGLVLTPGVAPTGGALVNGAIWTLSSSQLLARVNSISFNVPLMNGGFTANRVVMGGASGTVTDSPNFTFVTNRLLGTTFYVTLSAGTATAGTGPLIFTSSGTGLTGLLTVAVSGVAEFTTYGLWITTTAGTRNKVLHGLVAAAAPGTSAIGIVADYYGTSATRTLNTPNTWIAVVGDDGNTYKIPGYS